MKSTLLGDKPVSSYNGQNHTVQSRIWAVVGVICDILDALLHPDPLLVQLMFSKSQVI